MCEDRSTSEFHEFFRSRMKRKLVDEANGVAAKMAKSNGSKDILLLDSLRGSNALNALKEFVLDSEDFQDPENPIRKFLNEGGTAKDMLHLLDETDKARAPDVAVIFSACDRLLLYLAVNLNQEESDAKRENYQKLALDLTREILRNHIKYLMMLLSPSNTTSQSKSSLNLLTSMVACSTVTAKEVLLKIDFEHTALELLLTRRALRRDYMKFLLAFFVSSSNVIKDFLEKKNRLVSFFPGLLLDDCETVQLMLATLKTNLIENAGISKTNKMKLLSVFHLKPLLGLFQWKGPQGRKKKSQEDEPVVSDPEVHREELDKVRKVTFDFFLAALTSTKNGLVFHDPSGGTSGTNNNHLLQSLLQAISKPWEDPLLADIVVESLTTCPDQIRPYFIKTLQPLWAPTPNSSTWSKVFNMLTDIFEKLDVLGIVQSLGSKSDSETRQPSVKLMSNVVGNLFVNERLFKEVIHASVSHPDPGIQEKGLALLRIVLGKLQQLFDHWQGSFGNAKKQILFKLSEKVPALSNVVQLWTQVMQRLSVVDIEVDPASSDAGANQLLVAAETMDFYWKHLPQICEEFEMEIPKMLEEVHALQKTGKYSPTPLSQVQLVLLQKLAGSLSLSQSDLATKHMNLLVSLSTAHDNPNRHLALTTLAQILDIAGVYQTASGHLDLKAWMSFLPKEKTGKLVNVITDCLITAVKNKETLVPEAQDLTKSYYTSHADVVELSDGEQLVKALMQPDFTLDNVPSTFKTGTKMTTGRIQPFVLALVNSLSLQKHKEYFADSVTALVLLDVQPKCMASFLKSRQFKDSHLNAVLEAVEHPTDVDSIKYHDSNDPALTNQVEVMKLILQITSAPKKFKSTCQEVLNVVEKQPALSDAVLGQISVLETFDPLNFKIKTFNEMVLELLRSGNREKYLQQFLKCLETYKKSKLEDQGPYLDRLFETLVDARPNVSRIADRIRAIVPSDAGKFIKDTALSLTTRTMLACLQHDKSKALEVSSQISTEIMSALELILTQDDGQDEHAKFVAAVAKLIKTKSNPLLDQLSIVHVTVAATSKVETSLDFLQCAVESSPDLAALFFKWMMKEGCQEARFVPVVFASLKQQPEAKKKTINYVKTYVQNILLSSLKSADFDVNVDVLQNLINHLREQHDACTFELKEAEMELTTPDQLNVLRAASNDETRKQFFVHQAVQVITKHIKGADDCSAALTALCDNLTETSLELNQVGFLNKPDKKDAWILFVKSVLKNCMKLNADGAALVRSRALRSLSVVCSIMYSKNRLPEESKMMYELITGHSNFVALLFSQVLGLQRVRAELLELIVQLLQANTDILGGLDAHQLPLFLGAYKGTLTSCDRALLRIVFLHEDHRPGRLSSYQPLVWGQSAMSRYGTKSVSKVTKISEVLGLIEPEKMIRSAVHFPIHLPLFFTESCDLDSSLYDPRFFLPLVSQLCASGNYIDRHLKLIESGVLGLAFASLSSHDPSMRSLGCTVLSRIHLHIQAAKKSLSAEKQIWMHLINLVRNGLVASMVNNELRRIPSVVTTFLVRTCMILFHPLDPMYKSVSSFVLAKPALDVFSVPEFLRLFHSHNQGDDPEASQPRFLEERHWMLAVIRDGLTDRLEFNICQQNYVFKSLMSFYGSSLATHQTRKLIASVLDKVASLESTQPLFDLVKKHGLLNWMGDHRQSDEETVVNLFCKAWSKLHSQFQRQDSKSVLITNILDDFHLLAQDFLRLESKSSRLLKVATVLVECQTMKGGPLTSFEFLRPKMNDADFAQLEHLL